MEQSGDGRNEVEIEPELLEDLVLLLKHDRVVCHALVSVGFKNGNVGDDFMDFFDLNKRKRQKSTVEEINPVDLEGVPLAQRIERQAKLVESFVSVLLRIRFLLCEYEKCTVY